MDKRIFHNYLNNLKDDHNDYLSLIESIQETFEKNIDCITNDEQKALLTFPMQFCEKIPLEDGSWTTKLHIWGENCIDELLKVDPIVLTCKNGYGDTVLMCMVVGATGAHTEKINYKYIQRILEKDLTYNDIKIVDGNRETIEYNALDIKDINGQTVIDYLIDFAFAINDYENTLPDEKLQMMLKYFAEKNEDVIGDTTP
jgi:hypothetical protein